MFDPVNRREFLEQAAVAAAALHLAGSLTLAGETALAGQSGPADLMSYVDLLVRPVRTGLPDAENAMPLLKEAAKLLTEVPDGDFEFEDCFSSDKPDAERDRRIATWLDENRQTIPLVEQAVARGKLEFPGTPFELADRLEEVQSLRSLARFLTLRAQRLMSEGKIEEAVQTSRIGCEAFRLVEAGGGCDIEYLVAITCEGSLWSMTRQIAVHPKADAKTVRSLLAALPVRSDPMGGLRRTVQAELCYFFLPILAKTEGADLAKTIDILLDWDESKEVFSPRQQYELLREKLQQLFEGHPKPYDLADTVKRASAHSAASIRDLEIPWPTLKTRPEPAPSQELAAWPEPLTLFLGFGQEGIGEVTDSQIRAARKKLLRVENPIGKRLIATGGPCSVSLHDAAVRHQASYEGTRLLLAIRIFALERGELPVDLDALVGAKILDAVPLDSYSAAPFRYSRTVQAIWSVGADGQNSPAASGEAPEFEVCVWRLGSCLP